jgi:hypothetical protein
MRRLVVLTLASCAAASGNHGDPDAAAPPDAADPRVTIAVTAAGAPVADAQVFVHAADGSVIATAMTDAAGIAAVDPGPYVTTVAPIGGEETTYRLLTIASAEASDRIAIALDVPGAPPALSFRITAPPDPGAAGYHVLTTCGDGGEVPAAGNAPLDAMITIPPCAGMADLAVVSHAADGRALRATRRTAVAIAAGGVVSLFDPYTPLAAAEIDYSAVPAAIASIATARTSITPRGPLASTTGDATMLAGTGAVTLAAPIDPADPDATDLITAELIPAGDAVGHHGVITWGPPAPTRAIAIAPLPDYTLAPVFDPDARAVTWTAGAGRPADLAIVMLYTVRQEVGSTWRLAIPAPTAGRVDIPRLPAELVDRFDPYSRSTVVELTTAASSLPPPVMRAHALALTDPRAYAGTSGDIVIETLAPPPAL